MDVFGMDIKDANILLYQKQELTGGLNKINGNIANDTKAIKALKKEGWKIINLWECDLKPVKINKSLSSLLKKLS